MIKRGREKERRRGGGGWVGGGVGFVSRVGMSHGLHMYESRYIHI